jgi:hypothetical protein
MEKFLWNAGGVTLILANMACLAFFLFSNPWLFALIVILFLDYIYIDKRPTWVEV